MELGVDPAARRADPYAVRERRFELLLGAGQDRFLVGMRHHAPPAGTAGFLRAAFGLAHGPTAGGCIAGQAAPEVGAARLENRPAVALAELARREQVEGLGREVEEADEVRDRRAAASEAARELLLRDAEVLDEGRAGASLVDRAPAISS